MNSRVAGFVVKYLDHTKADRMVPASGATAAEIIAAMLVVKAVEADIAAVRLVVELEQQHDPSLESLHDEL